MVDIWRLRLPFSPRGVAVLPSAHVDVLCLSVWVVWPLFPTRPGVLACGGRGRSGFGGGVLAAFFLARAHTSW